MNTPTQRIMKNYKIGSIVLATDQGLGYLAKDFYDNGIIDFVYVHEHNRRENHYDWYPNRVGSIKELIDKSDTLLFFETMWEWKTIVHARERGVKTVLMPMYECTPNPMPYYPDLLLNPSALDQQYYPQGTLVTVPVPNWIKPKERQLAQHFVHNAGNGGLGGRNGTKELIQAMQHVKSPIKLTIRTQSNDFKCDDPRVEIAKGTIPPEELYNGDVFIFPEKFNGLSLPIQEAYASGMPIMCGKRFPMTEWLPHEIMIPIKGTHKEIICTEFDCADYNPVDIATTIDKWYNKDISELSRQGIEWGKNNSWNKLKDNYIKLCEPLRE